MEKGRRETMNGHLLDVANAAWRNEWHSEVEKVAAEMHSIFTHNNWTWSGQPVTEEMIISKLISLILGTARDLLSGGKTISVISSGRIQVEAHFKSSGEAHFMFNIHFIVVV